ncbi:hypothetical protein [Streptomyces ziwulingensis]|uniref:Uncharacterized protein n=1 Tax=Streptomyces ziwulingensis TaxID=1045501 RepID=A0ABP9CCE8_9ACTN
MHHHGYLWTGPKSRFDQDALRRPPHPEPPPPGSRPELIQRHREVSAAFPTSNLPPLETAYWLIKPRSLIRGTWDEARDAAEWLGERVAEYVPRSVRRAHWGTGHIASAVERRLAAGGDVTLGVYLERPGYLSLALVGCSPHRGRPELPCPLTT